MIREDNSDTRITEDQFSFISGSLDNIVVSDLAI